jgi:hypothetical protein
MPIPTEPPTASFLFEKAPWTREAACRGQEAVFLADEMDVLACRQFCANCTVRRECGEQASVEEHGADLANRFFIRGYMTPAQRVSVERRGGLRARDPMLLVQGLDGDRTIPPVPDEGDKFSKHHVTLGRKLVRYLDANIEKGYMVPDKVALCLVLECNPAPLARVLDALVQDGTLDIAHPPRVAGYVYRGGAGVVGSWLPLHLSDLGGHP